MSIIVNKNSQSIGEAISKSRNLSRDEKSIFIESGTYFLEEPIVLDHRDSGLKIRGGENVKLLGGKKIEGWRRKDDKLWSAKLPKSKEAWDFRMLVVNERWAPRARYPEEGFLIHDTTFDVEWLSTYEGGFERQPTYEELTTLKFNKADIGASFEPKNAELTVFHMWDESLVGVKSMDRENQIIKFTNPAGWPPGAFAKAYNFEKRYAIWNTIEGMQSPGQWFLDKANSELVYWPLAGENMEEASVIVPVLDNIIIIGKEQEAPVEDIRLEQLELSITNAPLMSGAFGAKLFDGALSIRNTNHCELKNLKIFNVGAHCIKASGDNVVIDSCHLYNAGAGAVRLMGSYGNINNNHIHDVGRTFPSAIAMYVGATDPNVPDEWEAGKAYTDCSIQHNEIHDVPYAAICAGGKQLKIIKNLIYRAMQNLYDGAGIYITFCNDAIVKHNFIKDIKDAPGAGTSAYYLDEKAINCIIEENVEINVPRPSHNHIAENNLFRNNIFIIKGKGKLSIERSKGYRIENNVIMASDGFELYDLEGVSQLKNNILYSGKGQLLTKTLNRYEVLSVSELKLTDGNINTDPQLTNYEDGKISFAANAVAHKMGIKEVDVSDAGLIKN